MTKGKVFIGIEVIFIEYLLAGMQGLFNILCGIFLVFVRLQVFGIHSSFGTGQLRALIDRFYNLNQLSSSY